MEDTSLGSNARDDRVVGIRSHVPTVFYPSTQSIILCVESERVSQAIVIESAVVAQIPIERVCLQNGDSGIESVLSNQ